MRKPYTPLGCDQQGRDPDRADPIADLDELEDETERFFTGLLIALSFTVVVAFTCLFVTVLL